MDVFLELQQLSQLKGVLEGHGISLEELGEMSMDDTRLASVKPFHKRKLIMGARAFLQPSAALASLPPPPPPSSSSSSSSSSAFDVPLFGSSLFAEPLFPASSLQPLPFAVPPPSQTEIVADEWCARCGACNLRDFRFCGACGAPAVRVPTLAETGSTTVLSIGRQEEELSRGNSATSNTTTTEVTSRPPEWKDVAAMKKKRW